jgi:hypothetical protein
MTAERSERPTRWHAVGVPNGRRSFAVLAAFWLVGLAWIGWPVWSSLTPPAREQSQAEAPWLMVALVSGLIALVVAMWADAGRRFDALSGVGALLVLNTVARWVLNPAAGGVEFVHALPLLAGMGLGAPAGFAVGAGSGLLSTIAIGDPATTLPTQALVWGLSGSLGGLLWRLRPRTAWLASLPLALVTGVVSGVLLNLMGWAQESGMTLTSFYPGLPPAEVLSRLWGYTLDTSIVLDLTRGVTTALILAVLGHPVLLALRSSIGALSRETRRSTPHPDQRSLDDVRPEAFARRSARTQLDHLWNQGEH